MKKQPWEQIKHWTLSPIKKEGNLHRKTSLCRSNQQYWNAILLLEFSYCLNALHFIRFVTLKNESSLDMCPLLQFMLWIINGCFFFNRRCPLQLWLFQADDGPDLRCLLSWYQFWFYTLAQFSRNRSRALKQKESFLSGCDHENLTLTSCPASKLEQTGIFLRITNSHRVDDIPRPCRRSL